jgi:hypothetical protein
MMRPLNDASVFAEAHGALEAEIMRWAAEAYCSAA